MERRQEIELLRIVSAFGIVWFHCSSFGKDIAYSGLVVFLILSMYFSANPDSKPKPISERAKRLLIPWALWLLFYGVLHVILKKPFIRTNNGIVAGILAGTSIHLWYMPFIFMAITLFDQAKKCIASQTLAYICALIIVFIFSITGFWRPWSSGLSSPWGQYVHALNGVFIGVFFANCGAMPRPIRLGFILLMLAAVALSYLDFPSVGEPYLIGITVTAVTLLPRWNFHFGLKFNALSDCTLGIYLSHPFWLLVFKQFWSAPDFTLPFLVFGVSAATVLCFKKATPNMSKYWV